MKTTRLFVVITLALSILQASCKKDLSVNLSGNAAPETLPAIQTAVSEKINANCAGYYQALPARYDSSSTLYSLIIFIHGIGELGNGTTDLPNMLRAGLPRLIRKKGLPASFEVKGVHHSFVVIAPQFRKWPTNEDVDAIRKFALDKYRIDPTRVYMTGLSMGGGVTWEYAVKYGSNLAAVLPICGGSWPDIKKAESIAAFNLPVWAFHNEDDKTVPVSFSRDYVSRINSFHPQNLAKVTTWATGGHDSWTKAYDPAYQENNENMYEWMLKFQLRTATK